LVGTGDSLQAFHHRAVADHPPVVIPIRVDDLGRHVRSPPVDVAPEFACRSPVAGDRHRIDRTHWLPATLRAAAICGDRFRSDRRGPCG
jgi:hypothetical protein